MSDWTLEYLRRKDLEDQLEFYRGKKQEYEEHIQDMCLHAEQYKELFETKIAKLEFQSYKYKDSETYDKCLRMKKMYNMFKFILDRCR